jgi:hypothetical protein
MGPGVRRDDVSEECDAWIIFGKWTT